MITRPSELPPHCSTELTEVKPCQSGLVVQTRGYPHRGCYAHLLYPVPEGVIRWYVDFFDALLEER